MKVACYCQHLLGIGHLRRTLEICRALASEHATTLILGGPPVSIDSPGILVRQLPGLRMDEGFGGLLPCEAGRTLTEIKEQRRALLFSLFREDPPDLLLTELYPFGRKAFRFELEPLLDSLHDGTLHRCLICCSVRDVLVEKNTGREKFEKWVVSTLNSRFDGVLIHADPKVISLDETFGLYPQITIPRQYTGFIAPSGGTPGSRARIRAALGLAPADRLIVASIGGGGVGGELLRAVGAAFQLLGEEIAARLQIFTGPYCPPEVLAHLAELPGENILIDRFTEEFPDWLAAADLSVSMAGYNTVLSLVQAGVPALVLPFGQNREQRFRAERLAGETAITVLADTDLTPATLARKMLRHMQFARKKALINLDGAAESVRQLTAWYSAGDWR
jgi:predicted glycosyltransferase